MNDNHIGVARWAVEEYLDYKAGLCIIEGCAPPVKAEVADWVRTEYLERRGLSALPASGCAKCPTAVRVHGCPNGAAATLE